MTVAPSTATASHSSFRRARRRDRRSNASAVAIVGLDASGRQKTVRGKALLACKLLARELAEALSGSVVRAERLVVRVLRVGRDLFCDGAHFPMQRLVVPRIAEQRLDPRLVRVLRGALLLEEQLAEQDPDADIRKRLEREDPVRRADELLDLGVFGLDLRDDV